MLSRRDFLKVSATAASIGLAPPAHRPGAQGSGEVFLPLLTGADSPSGTEPKPATSFTRAINQAVLDQLPFGDRDDYEDAAKGLIAELPNHGVIPNPNPKMPPIWSLPAYAFLEDPAPPEANPSLWRQAQLNMYNGLFEVVPGIYQVRGADLSNMTIIEGQNGIIVIDPLVSTETARMALDLYRQERGQRQVVAVIYSHSHTDHYGGVRGVVDEDDVQAGKVEILAPDRFLEKVMQRERLRRNCNEPALFVLVWDRTTARHLRPDRRRAGQGRVHGHGLTDRAHRYHLQDGRAPHDRRRRDHLPDHPRH